MPPPRPPGGYTVDDLREGDRFELTDGELIECHPAGGRHAGKVSKAAQVLGADAARHATAADVGHALGPRTLRAPDVSVGGFDPDCPGWAQGPPLLAVEYADIGQDEEDLQKKIMELLGAGTRYVWVVRLVGMPRVEVYQNPVPKKKTYGLDEVLTAPGVLKNPLPVTALFDEQLADKLTLRSLLDRYGEAEHIALHAKASLLLLQIEAKKIALTPEQHSRIRLCQDDAQLGRWATALLTAATAAELGL